MCSSGWLEALMFVKLEEKPGRGRALLNKNQLCSSSKFSRAKHELMITGAKMPTSQTSWSSQDKRLLHQMTPETVKRMLNKQTRKKHFEKYFCFLKAEQLHWWCQRNEINLFYSIIQPLTFVPQLSSLRADVALSADEIVEDDHKTFEQTHGEVGRRECSLFMTFVKGNLTWKHLQWLLDCLSGWHSPSLMSFCSIMTVNSERRTVLENIQHSS